MIYILDTCMIIAKTKLKEQLFSGKDLISKEVNKMLENNEIIYFTSTIRQELLGQLNGLQKIINLCKNNKYKIFWSGRLKERKKIILKNFKLPSAI